MLTVSNIINGKEIAANLRKGIALKTTAAKDNFGVTPTLAVILVGTDPASEIYVRNKEKAAHETGMNSIQFKLSGDIAESELIAKIQELNNDEKVHGILVQLPLPDHIDSKKVIQTIDYRKDVDGFHLTNVGKLASGIVSGTRKSNGSLHTPWLCSFIKIC